MSRFASMKARRIAITSTFVVVLAILSAWFVHKYFWLEASNLAVRLWPPPTAAQVELRNLRRIAGWFSLDCGHVRYRQDADAAIVCAQGALKAGRRFYVSFDGKGIDSHFSTGIAADSTGAVFEVFTNEMPGVAGYADNLGIWRTETITRCAPGTVEEVSNFWANRYLQCRPLSR